MTTSRRGDNPAANLDAYLDGLLSPADTYTFEALIARDPDLRSQVDLQRHIDLAIKRLFAAPRAPSLESIVRAAPPASGRRPLRSWGAWIALAAALCLAALGAWRWTAGGWPFGATPSAPGTAIARVEPDAVYRDVVNAGFKPDWVCATDEDFAGHLGLRYGQRALVKPAEGVQVVGWGLGAPVLARKSAVLLVEAAGEKVVVLFDRLTADRALSVPPASGLNIFRREIGNLVAYEVTPADRARVLDLIYIPQRPQ